ncbi:pyridoxal phosphate-dependent aminotransferase [Legionella sp. D16C41]|uniref:pyridoxal phosphate-dependent aminotransferase n=1 Tax=Legionella sp. D16C41 TaxID=3402688 RepID=UPI003AF4E61D
MHKEDQIILADRTYATPDAIDAIFQQLDKVSKSRIAMGLDPVISLCVGEPHLPINKEVLTDLIAYLGQKETASQFQYSSPAGCPETLAAIKKLYQVYYPSVEYNEDEVMISSGATQGLWNAFNVLVNPGDSVVAFTPFYPTYKVHTEAVGGKFIALPYLSHYLPNLDELKATLTHNKVKLLILNFPNNPSGVDLNQDILRELCTILNQHPEVAIIIDDVYRELTVKPHLTILDIDPSFKNRTVVINSASKGLIGAPNMRIGMIAAGAKLIAAMATKQATEICSVSSLTQQALIAAVNSKINCSPSYEEWIVKAKLAYQENTNLVSNALDKLGCQSFYGGNGFYLLVDFSHLLNCHIPNTITFTQHNKVIKDMHNKIGADTFSSDVEIAAYLLHAAGVATIPASGFGIDSKQGILRFSCAKDTALLLQAIENISVAMQEVSRVNKLVNKRTEIYSGTRFFPKEQPSAKENKTISANLELVT